MIRVAKHADQKRMVEVLEDGYLASHYAQSHPDSFDRQHANRLLAQAIQRHGGKAAGATWVAVAETDGVVQGLILGVMERAYHVGTHLEASDMFWYATKAVHPLDPLKLLDSMIAWAKSSPRCGQVRCGATGIIGDFERLSPVFARRGFERYGAIWRREIKR